MGMEEVAREMSQSERERSERLAVKEKEDAAKLEELKEKDSKVRQYFVRRAREIERMRLDSQLEQEIRIAEMVNEKQRKREEKALKKKKQEEYQKRRDSRRASQQQNATLQS